MTPVKRLDIVIDKPHAEQVIAALASVGIRAYSMVPHVLGRGERGERRGDELTDVFTNVMILTTCPPDLLPKVNEKLRPLLKAQGGICLVSDAHLLIH